MHLFLKNRSVLPVLILLLPTFAPTLFPFRTDALTMPLQNRSELLNGMKVAVAERPGQTTASVALVIFAGADADESGKAGTASLTARMLLAATPQRGSPQIAADIADSGLRANAYADYDASWFRVSGAAKDVGSMLELVSDLVLNANFDEKELSKLKERVRAEIRARRAQPEGLADLHFREKLLGMHPYGFPAEGVDRTLSEISRADCVKFYQRFYHPNNVMLLVVGGVRTDDVISKLRISFGGWKHLPVSAILRKSSQQPVGVRIRLIDQPMTEHVLIHMGRVGVERTNRDYYNLEVLNFILGGEGYASRFADRLQKKQSWATMVSSDLEYHLWPGLWRVNATVIPAQGAPAVAALIDEIKKVSESKVSDQELAGAVTSMNSQFNAQHESNDQILDALAKIEIYGLALDTVIAYAPHLIRVTPEDLQRAARQYLDPDSLVVIVVGNATALKPELEKIGTVEVFPAY